jgi:prepilin-type N-terminal cleavage/methylation domain-containing protein
MIFIRHSRPDTRIVRWTGFTLTELMIVVAIIGLLAAIAMPAFVKARDNSRLNVIYHNLREIDSAKEQWAMEQKKATGAAVNDISDLGDYLRRGKVNDVIRENYIPNPVGTPPEAALPSGIGLGPYAPGALIPAP